MIKFRPSARYDKPATVIFLSKEQSQKKDFPPGVNGKTRTEIAALIKNGRFSGEKGELFPLTRERKIVLLAGLGETKDLTQRSLRTAVRQALLSAYLKKSAEVEVIPHEESSEAGWAVIDGYLLGTYSWRKYKGGDNGKGITSLHVVSKERKEYTAAIKACEGTTLARDLVNENADTVTSAYFEKTIRGLIKGKKNVSIEVLNKKELKAKGLNLHLAVNQGSAREPKLIIVKYQGAGAKGAYTALIGKGITFDTGGLNIKPTGHIETMRCDMGGAAAVVGTLKNALLLNIKKNILFVVGLAENVTGSLSYKPGDVFKSYSGKTVEIGNTDAEGRLVLADAIAYTVKNYKPHRLIALATLTGACVVALGHDYSGLVCPDDAYARDLVHSSNATDDRIWRLPSYPELKDAVKSEIADIKNIGFPRGAGGTITAAEFLRQFTDDTLWAHLDIAGTAFLEGGGRGYFSYGGTGAGVRLLTHYLLNN